MWYTNNHYKYYKYIWRPIIAKVIFPRVNLGELRLYFK